MGGLILVVAAAMAPAAGRVETIAVESARLPQPVRVEVLVPPGWRPGSPAHLVVFLHDGFGTQRSFRKRQLGDLAWGLMRGGAMAQAVIASPRHRGTFLIDGPRGAMESFVAEELVPALEARYPGAGGKRERRSVWGISMGGYGALKMALRHPRAYGRAGALAPWVQELSWAKYERERRFLARLLVEPAFGRTAQDNRFDANDLYRIAAAADPAAASPMMVRTGGRDRWEPGALLLVEYLRERGFPVEARSIPEAGHDWPDWQAAAPELLRWLAPAPPVVR